MPRYLRDVTARHEVGLLKLVAQRIAGPSLATPADAVRWLTAVQAQDWRGALASVALRCAPATRQAVESSLVAGEIVRSWPMRGTLHLVVAEDLKWMLDLMAPRVVAGASARRAQLGLTAHMLERARELAVQALTDGHQLRRQELLGVWESGGLPTAGQRGYHMLWHLAQTGSLCLGPVRDGEQLVVLTDEWIGHRRRPDRAEALGELARRYFASHGPATIKDFMRWTNLLAADARAGLELARPELVRIEVEGVEHYMDPQTPDQLDACRREARGVFLLPGFDEFILGYQDRRAVLPAEFAARIVPGGNGVFRPTVVSGGQVVGTWKEEGRGSKRTVSATSFTSFTRSVEATIPGVYAALP
jgi:hypothetical protein